MVSNVWCQRIPMVKAPTRWPRWPRRKLGDADPPVLSGVNQRSFDWAMASIAKCNSHYQLISEISTDGFWKYRLEYCSVDVWIEESQEIWKMFDADRILHPCCIHSLIKNASQFTWLFCLYTRFLVFVVRYAIIFQISSLYYIIYISPYCC